MPDQNDNSLPRGVRIRSDLVEAFIFRRRAGAIDLLQMRRRADAKRSPGTWQPVLGHIEEGESALEAARREVGEETGLEGADCLGWWQLEQVHPFFVADANAIFLCPRFVVEAAASWEPVLDNEHEAHRWVALGNADDAFIWPGQREAIREFTGEILDPSSATAALLRLD